MGPSFLQLASSQPQTTKYNVNKNYSNSFIAESGRIWIFLFWGSDDPSPHFLLGIKSVPVSVMVKQFYSVFRIRMDPGFFADPDPGFESPDPSINKLMGSK